MITRKDYMGNRNSHRAYYSQFVTAEMEDMILTHIGLDRLLASKDRAFNDIPIHEWDAMLYSMYDRRTNKKLRDRDASIEFGNNMAYYTKWHFDRRVVNVLMQKAADYPSLSGYICVFKECAKQIVERTVGRSIVEYQERVREESNAQC